LPVFWPEPPAAMPEDHIASPQFFQGALAQKCFSNSICKLLKLVNSVENRRKIKKMQTQFCWFRCENTTTFVILRWSDSRYF
jgi:hypothetical protein